MGAVWIPLRKKEKAELASLKDSNSQERLYLVKPSTGMNRCSRNKFRSFSSAMASTKCRVPSRVMTTAFTCDSDSLDDSLEFVKYPITLSRSGNFRYRRNIFVEYF